MVEQKIAAVGVALSAVAVASCLIAPARLTLVIPIRAPGAHQVVIPIVYWLAVVVAALVLTRVTGSRLRHALARVASVAFVVHAIVLLAASVPSLTDRAVFATPIYWMYARLFCSAVLGATIAWLVYQVHGAQRSGEWFAILPIGFAAAVLAASLSWRDPSVAAGAIIAGVAVGIGARSVNWASLDRDWPTHTRPIDDDRLFLVAMSIGALAVRLLFAARVMTNPDFVETGADGAFYDRLAWSLAEGHRIGETQFPLLLFGYVRFLAVVYRVAGHNYFAACVAQSVIGSAVVVGIYAVGRPIFGRAAARIAAFFSAVSYQLIFSAVALGHQAVDVGLTLLIVWALIRAIARQPARWWEWLAIGVTCGCAIAVRETNVFFLAFVGLWLPYAMTGPARWARTLRAAAWLMVGVCLVMMPIVAPMVATADSRLRLRHHLDRLMTSPGDVPERAGLAKPFSDPRAAWSQLYEQPGFVVRTEVAAFRRNFALQFLTQLNGGFDLLFLAAGSSYFYGMWSYAYLFTIVGLCVSIRRIVTGDPHAAAIGLMVGLLASRTAPHLVLESGYRHRTPLEPFLILICAAGVAAVVSLGGAQSRALPFKVAERPIESP